MRIHIFAAESAGTLAGNWITARRWESILRDLGHEVSCGSVLPDSIEGLVALHARRSAPVVREASERHPAPWIVVGLTGTDIYKDIPAGNADALATLARATRLVALQADARSRLPAEFQERCRVIPQSAAKVAASPRGDGAPWRFVVVGTQREERDVLMPARAIAHLPGDLEAKVRWIGEAEDENGAAAAREFERAEPRFEWAGPLSHAETLRELGEAHAVLIPSTVEGSSNVLIEALALGVPVLASRIPGLVATLGDDWPGWFPAGDVDELAGLIQRFCRDLDFRNELERAVRAFGPDVEPAAESAAWASLMEALQGKA